jgi:Ca2+-binding EF-hand superfamily protein
VPIARFGLLLLLGATLLIGGPDTALPQFQQGSGGNGPAGGFGGGRSMRGGGGGRGMRGGNFDPSQWAARMFDRYARGQDYIVIDQVQNPRDPEMKDRLTQFAEREGITNGQLNRDQFTKYMQEQMAQRMAGQGGAPGGRAGGPSAANGGPVDEAQLRERFQAQDRDGDGKLTPDEIRGRLGQDFSLWDKNRDGAIDFDEYKEYFLARSQQGSGGNDQQWQGAWLPVQEPPTEDPRPTVYRAGNLPRELLDRAPWFPQLDRDRDGQVGLYEWKEAGRTLDDFRALDLNGDGFVTAEEALRYLKKTMKDTTSRSDTQVAFRSPDGGGFRGPGRGMFPRSSGPRPGGDGGDWGGGRRGGRGGRQGGPGS